MRIISGALKGRKLKYPVPDGVRPTQDAVREMIFNVLGHHFEFGSKTAADICAGTGAFGFEAFSRGCKHIFFFEKNRKTAANLQKNADDILPSPQFYNIIEGDALTGLKHFQENFPGNRFDLVFLDPPYQLHLNNSLTAMLLSCDLLNENAIIVSETSSAEYPLTLPQLSKITDKVFGDTRVSIFIKK